MAKAKIIPELPQIIKLYVDKGLSLTQISKQFPYSVHVLSSALKRKGIEIINRQNLLNFDFEKDILPAYNNGESLTSIAKKFSTTRHALSRGLKKLGITIVNTQNQTKFNENIFDYIDTEEKAYWLGFIWADGYISSKNNTFEIKLSIKDIEHLYKFNSFMQHNKNNVKTQQISFKGKTFITCRWSVVNKHLHQVLNSYGCVPNKSLVLQFPDIKIFENEGLVRHFIRGYFDGDGCISYISKNGVVQPQIVIMGTKPFLEFLNSWIRIPGYCKKSKSEAYEWRNSCNSARQLIQYLYNDCSIYLERKFKRAMFFKDHCRSTKELVELLASENGEGCDVNPVISEDSNESSTL